MKNEKKTEIKVGITVLAGIILFIIIYGWAKNLSVSSNNLYLDIEFPTVAGLEIGDMVSVNGVRKGIVESIESKGNMAHVRVKFFEEIPLKEDATFSVMMLDLMGGKKIEISSGESDRQLDFNLTQNGYFAGDISTVMATLNFVEGDLVELIGDLKKSLSSANTILSDKTFSDDLSASVANLRSLTYNLNELLLVNKEAILNSVKNIESLSEKTNSMLDNNSDKLQSVLQNLDSALVRSNKVLNDISVFTDETGRSGNNLGKMLYDEDLMNDLRISLKQIKELTEIINGQLKSGGLEVKADVDLF